MTSFTAMSSRMTSLDKFARGVASNESTTDVLINDVEQLILDASRKGDETAQVLLESV